MKGRQTYDPDHGKRRMNGEPNQSSLFPLEYRLQTAETERHGEYPQPIACCQQIEPAGAVSSAYHSMAIITTAGRQVRKKIDCQPKLSLK